MSSSSTSFSASARPVRASVLPRARKIGQAQRPFAGSDKQPGVPSYARPTASSLSRSRTTPIRSILRRPSTPLPPSCAPSEAQSCNPISRPPAPSDSRSCIPVPRSPAPSASQSRSPTLAHHAPSPPSLGRFGFLKAAPVDAETEKQRREEAQPLKHGNFARLLVRVLEGKHLDKTLPRRLDAFRKAEEKRVVDDARKVRERDLKISCRDQIPIYSAAVAAPHPPRSVHWAPVLTKSRQFDLTEAPVMVRRATRFSSQA